jgi:hypothetical protein
MLNELKTMLGIVDTSMDEMLKLIISAVTARLRVLLGGIDPPDSLDYIIREVCIVRYNKIGSEGMTSHTVEGESHTFTDSDFAGYMDDIQAYLESQKTTAKGRVRFL